MLIYKVVLIFRYTAKDLTQLVYMYFLRFFYTKGYYKILNTVA